MDKKIKIGFAALCMADFDAVLDVADVKSGQIEDISKPEYLMPMEEWLNHFGEVVMSPVVGDVVSAKAAGQWFLSEKIDVLIVHEFAFTLATTFIALVERLDVPIVFWNTQMTRKINSDQTDFGVFMANNSVSSIPHSTNVLFQQKREFKVITGHMEDAGEIKRLENYLKAVRAKKMLSEARIGSVGYVYPGMTTIMVNDTSFIHTFGTAVEHINPAEVGNYYCKVTDKEAKVLADQVENTYQAKGLTEDELLRSAKYYFAVKQMMSDKKLDSLALLCGLLILEPDMGVAPCLGLSLLSSEGIHSSCECDIPAVTCMMIAQELAGNAHFTEFYMMDMEEGLLLMAHCGYGNVSLANKNMPVKLVPQQCFPGPAGNGAAFEYTAKEGKITILSLTEYPGGYKLVAAKADCVEAVPCQAGCPQTVVRFEGVSLADGVEKFCQAGGSHHMAFCYGDITEELEMLSRLLKIDYERIN